jgi:hypothetical protein
MEQEFNEGNEKIHKNYGLFPWYDHCDCCGKHLSRLEPIEHGRNEGARLINVWRPDGPYDEEAELAWDEALKHFESEGFKSPMDRIINKYGKEKGRELIEIGDSHTYIRKRPHCKDCARLDDEEYFSRRLGE